MADMYSRVGVSGLLVSVLFMRTCFVAGLDFTISPSVVKEGARVMFTCTTPAASSIHSFEIKKTFPDGKSYLIATNTEMSQLYKNYPRWGQNIAIDTVGNPSLSFTLSGALAEDAGTFVCKFGNLNRTVELQVQMPVTEVYVTAKNASGSVVRYSDGATIQYGQPISGSPISTSPSSMLRLVAVVNGSLYPPTKKVMIGGNDVTAQFTDVKPAGEESVHKEAGLGSYRLTQKYAWLDGDKSMYSGKTLIFTASVADTAPKSISVKLNIPFAPKVNCGNASPVAVLGGRAVITCVVKANPFNDVKALHWKWNDGQDTVTLHPNNRFQITYSANITIVDEFTRRVQLNIDKVKAMDFRTYHLSVKMYNKVYQDSTSLEYANVKATSKASGLLPCFLGTVIALLGFIIVS